jgi:hypothetical protein
MTNNKNESESRSAAPCMHLRDDIPSSHNWGLLTIDVRQECSGLDVSILHKTESALVAKAEKCTR